jgi:hypothetical protein
MAVRDSAQSNKETHMSPTTSTPLGAPNSAGAPTTSTDQAFALAEDGAMFLSQIETTNPALYAQLVGSLATYGKSAAAPVVGSVLGLLVAHYGLGPYVTADTLSFLTDALVGLGTAGGAMLMHWIGKAPGRALGPPAP